jgi:hypothetical protein
VYASAVHAPELQLGYQLSRARTLLELGMSGGYTPRRRFHLPDQPSNLDGSWSLGGVVTASHNAWRLDAHWRVNGWQLDSDPHALRLSDRSAFPADSADQGTELSSNACYLWRETSLCANGQYLSSVPRGPGPMTSLFAAGIALQLGQMEWLE